MRTKLRNATDFRNMTIKQRQGFVSFFDLNKAALARLIGVSAPALLSGIRDNLPTVLEDLSATLFELQESETLSKYSKEHTMRGIQRKRRKGIAA